MCGERKVSDECSAECCSPGSADASLAWGRRWLPKGQNEKMGSTWPMLPESSNDLSVPRNSLIFSQIRMGSPQRYMEDTKDGSELSKSLSSDFVFVPFLGIMHWY